MSKEHAPSPWALIEGADWSLVRVSVIQADALDGDPEKTDAFARVWIGRKKMKNRTQVYQNSNAPQWNETFDFTPVPLNSADYRTMLVEVFDVSSGKPRDLGYFKVDLWALTLNDKIKGWFDLKEAPAGRVLCELRVSRCTDEESSKVLRASIRKRFRETGQKYEDPDFRADMSSVYPRPPAKQYPHLGKKISQWLRPCDLVEDPQMFCNGVEAGDVIQGVLGDCYFLGAASIVATRDDLLYPIVVEQAPECGFHTFKFFKNGNWHFVTIDDRLPLSQRKQLVFGRCQDPREMWVPLMEKAYAKIHNCYQNVEAGSIAQALMDLTGEAPETFKWDKEKFPAMHKKAVSGEFFDMITTFVVEEQWLVGCSFNTDDGREEDMGMGILSGHAYALLDCKKVKTDAGKEVRLLKIRNPWGMKEWTGAWSDDSPEWTPRLMKELNHTASDDGTFWINYENFLLQYNQVMMVRLLTDEIGHVWSKTEVYDSWVGSSAAGSSANRTLWYMSPQYDMVVDRECEMFICLAQEDLRPRGQLKYPIGVGFDVRSDPNIHPSLPCVLNADKGLVLSVDYCKGREVSQSFTFEPGRYRFIPSVYEPGAGTRYYLVLYTFWPIKFERIRWNVVDATSAWKHGRDGGCTFYDSWPQNPRFQLIPEHDRTVRVAVLLQQTSGSGQLPADIYIASRCDPNKPLKKSNLVVHTDEPTSAKMLVVYATMDAADAPFIIMPVTSEPKQHVSFLLRVLSPLKDVYDVRELE